MWGRGEYGRLGLGDDCADKQRPVELTLGSWGGDPRPPRIIDAALGGTQPAQSSLAPNWYDAVVEHQKAAPAPTSVQVWYSTPRYVKGKTHASGT